MSLFDLTGHTSVVTGGNRGIGLGMARGLGKAGASVVIWSRDEVRNRAAIEELNGLGIEASALVCDVASEESVAAALATTLERYGKVHSLFANAGTSGAVTFPDLSLDEWHRVLDVNLTGVFLTAREVSRHMIERGEGGSMVFTASLAARFGLPLAPHYTATKGAVLQLARALAVRLARHGIRVNALSPGWVDTEMTEAVQADARANQLFMARTPMRRWGTAHDFEGPAVFLASPASGFVTGAELAVDGGFSAS